MPPTEVIPASEYSRVFEHDIRVLQVSAVRAFVEPADRDAPSTLRTTLLIGVLLLFCIFAVIDRTVIAMLIDPIRKSLDISDSQVGLLMGIAYAAAYGLAGLPMGFMVDRYPRKWILYFAVTFWGLAEAACGLSTGFVWLFLARAAVGLGESPLHPSAHSIIADSVPRRRLATVMSIYSMGNLLGTGFALIIGGWIVHYLLNRPNIVLPLIGPVESWQFAFIITGLPGLLLALLILPFAEPRRIAHGRANVSWAELFEFIRGKWQVVLCLSIVFGGMNIANGGLIKWAPSYMSRFFHLNPAQYGLALGLIESIFAISGLLVSGWIIDRWYASGRKDAHLTYYLWAIILTTPIVLLGLTSNSLVIFYVGMAFGKTFTVNFLGVAASQVQMISPPHMRGRLSGLFFLMVVALLGSSLGALVPALIADNVFHDNIHLGKSMALTLAIFAPLAVIAILWGRKYVRAAVDEAEAMIITDRERAAQAP
ncbi:MAG: hypothetical protein JWP15_1044 [Alphaproteobacteria bacterium]|nr:hypothetical protein [Alphaproteobacteria bacterium]